MAEPTNPVPPNADELVIPRDVAPSGHGGTAPAPVPHPLTPEANKDTNGGENLSNLSNPENNTIDEGAVEDEDDKKTLSRKEAKDPRKVRRNRSK